MSDQPTQQPKIRYRTIRVPVRAAFDFKACLEAEMKPAHLRTERDHAALRALHEAGRNRRIRYL